jgi:hypothetical protein
MSPLDAEFFYAEHRNVPMHIGSVAVFDGPALIRADLMRRFEARLPRVLRCRQVVRRCPSSPKLRDLADANTSSDLGKR